VLQLMMEEVRMRRERWKAVEGSKACMAVISVCKFYQRFGGTRRVTLGVLRGREGEGGKRVVGNERQGK
jgi:hypothetical protein